MSGAALSASWSAARNVLRGWTWAMSAWAALVGAVTLIALGTPLAPSMGERKYIVPLLYNIIQFGFPLVFAVQLADRAVDRGVRAFWAYGAAVLVVAVLGTGPIARALWPLLGKEPYWDVGNDLWLGFNALLYHALGVGAYAQWRSERAARERLQYSERDRAARQRQITASRLLALQARVEPQLLFDALARVDAALAEHDDEGRAERRLADLIDLLRAMQPAAHARASTLGREVALVEAHARVGAEVGLQPGWLNFEIDLDAANAALAPLVLLPLLRRLTAVPTWRWRMAATCNDKRLRIALVATGAGPASFNATLQTIDLEELRQRLVAVHGPGTICRADTEREPQLTIELDAPDDAHPDR